MAERVYAKVSYFRRAYVTCPNSTCNYVMSFEIDDPLNFSNLPQVGETISCSTCKFSFVINSEELM